MKLYVVRHGETYENVNKITQGHLNSRLTPYGEEQARRIALRLRDEELDYCYSSDLERCVKTAEIILTFHTNVKLKKLPELREQMKGNYEGRPRIEIRAESARLNQEWWQFHPERGERMSAVWERMVNFYEEVRTKHSQEVVLLVSHGAPISCLLSYLRGDTLQNIDRYAPREKTAISIINIGDGSQCEFEVLNCIKHLN